jgi:hypothetical protein
MGTKGPSCRTLITENLDGKRTKDQYSEGGYVWPAATGLIGRLRGRKQSFRVRCPRLGLDDSGTCWIGKVDSGGRRAADGKRINTLTLYTGLSGIGLWPPGAGLNHNFIQEHRHRSASAQSAGEPPRISHWRPKVLTSQAVPKVAMTSPWSGCSLLAGIGRHMRAIVPACLRMPSRRLPVGFIF